MKSDPVLCLLVARLERLVGLETNGDSKYESVGLFLVTWDLVFMFRKPSRRPNLSLFSL